MSRVTYGVPSKLTLTSTFTPDGVSYFSVKWRKWDDAAPRAAFSLVVRVLIAVSSRAESSLESALLYSIAAEIRRISRTIIKGIWAD